MLRDDLPNAFERTVVSRTVLIWRASYGSVDVQLANPSSGHSALLHGLHIGNI